MPRVLPRCFALVTAMAMAVSLSSGVAAAQTPAGQTQAQEVEHMAKKTKSFNCVKPAGKKINTSWEKGNTSTTIYFNNHCATKADMTVITQDLVSQTVHCITIPKGKSNRKFNHGLTGSIYSVQKTCIKD